MEKIIADFQNKTLQIDFLELSLTQNKEIDAILYQGNGYIRQTDEDEFVFKLYPQCVKNTNFTKFWINSSPETLGTLYGTEKYFTLSGKASDGSTWSAKNVLPECDWASWNKYPIVKGSLASCERDQTNTPLDTLCMHYFDKLQLPISNKKVEFCADDHHFNLEKNENGFIVTVSIKKNVNDYFPMRIEEALRFLLAQSVTHRVLSQHGRIKFFSNAKRPHLAQLPPPISLGSPVSFDHSWRLFDRYLTYIVRETEQHHWHACSNHLHNVCEASASALDAWAVGLSVAVEGLTDLLPNKIDSINELKDLQTFIVKKVSDSPEHKAHVGRIEGLVSSLTLIRAVDKMEILVKNGKIDDKCVKAWSKLRNSSVHAKLSIGNYANPCKLQKLVDSVNQVIALMYNIIFVLIDYKGMYTNYAVRNFPEQEFK